MESPAPISVSTAACASYDSPNESIAALIQYVPFSGTCIRAGKSGRAVIVSDQPVAGFLIFILAYDHSLGQRISASSVPFVTSVLIEPFVTVNITRIISVANPTAASTVFLKPIDGKLGATSASGIISEGAWIALKVRDDTVAVEVNASKPGVYHGRVLINDRAVDYGILVMFTVTNGSISTDVKTVHLMQIFSGPKSGRMQE